MLTLRPWMPSHIFYGGAALVIQAAVRLDHSMPSKDFLYSLDDKEKAKIYALFRMLGDTGQIRNTEKFKKIEGTCFFEFKSFQIRMPCFFAKGKRVFITHGFIKKKDKIPKPELDKANQIMAEHIAGEGGRG